jgi:hypothetical protein
MARLRTDPAGEDAASHVVCCADRDHSVSWCPCDNHVRSGNNVGGVACSPWQLTPVAG